MIGIIFKILILILNLSFMFYVAKRVESKAIAGALCWVLLELMIMLAII